MNKYYNHMFYSCTQEEYNKLIKEQENEKKENNREETEENKDQSYNIDI